MSCRKAGSTLRIKYFCAEHLTKSILNIYKLVTGAPDAPMRSKVYNRSELFHAKFTHSGLKN